MATKAKKKAPAKPKPSAAPKAAKPSAEVAALEARVRELEDDLATLWRQFRKHRGH